VSIVFIFFPIKKIGNFRKRVAETRRETQNVAGRVGNIFRGFYETNIGQLMRFLTRYFAGPLHEGILQTQQNSKTSLFKFIFLARFLQCVGVL